MMFGIAILWIALVVLVVWGVKSFTDHTEDKGEIRKNDEFPIDIQRDLPAKGENEGQEFEEQKQTWSL